MTGKPLCASKADESASPVFTRLATSSNWAAKWAFFWILASICERAQNRQAGADQRQELLVEDEKRLQLDLAPRAAAKARARSDREDVVAGMGKAGAQLLGGGRGLHLLLHAAALIGQLDDELRHVFRSPAIGARLFQGILPTFRVPVPTVAQVTDRREKPKLRSKRERRCGLREPSPEGSPFSARSRRAPQVSMRCASAARIENGSLQPVSSEDASLGTH